MYRFNHPAVPNTRSEQKTEQSNRSTTPGGISWKKALAISALPLAFLFGAAFQSPNSVPGQLQAIQAQLSALQAQVTSLANKGPRKFYLTQNFHDGAEAPLACAQGYHMASLREIFDTSNLRYDTDLGFTVDDAGFGPPSFTRGWIRTGIPASAGSAPGGGNCNAWTSAVSGDNGTTVGLDFNWNAAGTVVSPWAPSSNTCNFLVKVWCVQD
jgi:hypothetical protein